MDDRTGSPTARRTSRQITPAPTESIARPVLVQRWDQLAYLHWRYPADEVQALLPPGLGLEVDTFDGSAWVGLVPFVMRDLRPPGIPPVPWLSTFVEVNVRTYVVDGEGRRGVWFFSLDATRSPAVATARALFRLPYCWAAGRFTTTVPAGGDRLLGAGDRLRYETRRRRPHATHGARSLVEVEVGEAVAPTEVSALEHFLTARWGLVTGKGRWGPVHHDSWPLHRGRLLELDAGVVAAAGLRPPGGEPDVLVSPGVVTRVGWPTPDR